MATTRINMKHGFMKSIIKNQVDRDKYDKEVRAKLEGVNPQSGQCKQPKYRPKKPDKEVYMPPYMKKENKHHLFVLEFEDRNGQTHTVDVHKEDAAESLAEELGSRCSLKPAYVSALFDRIQQEMDMRL